VERVAIHLYNIIIKIVVLIVINNYYAHSSSLHPYVLLSYNILC